MDNSRIKNARLFVKRLDNLDCDAILADFVETLLDVETDLRDATEWQWDGIVRDACRQRKDERQKQEAQPMSV